MSISFSSSPPFAAARKRGARSHVDISQPIASNQVDLIEDVRLNILSSWRRGVNLRSDFVLARAVIPEMLRMKCGAIVNVASKAAFEHISGNAFTRHPRRARWR
jgi:NAD(P)-dependent dehydrogenase (short-subunit alcohol dehydrogenase family)